MSRHPLVFPALRFNHIQKSFTFQAALSILHLFVLTFATSSKTVDIPTFKCYNNIDYSYIKNYT